jgi:RimJ/RimL family protein N-acetyltransferase
VINSINLHIRVVREGDSQILMRWRNLPEVRKWSRNSQEIELSTHEKWFEERMVQRDKLGPLFIVEVSGSPVGMVRLDLISECTFEISVLVDPKYHRRGIAESAINLAIHALAQKTEDFTLHAIVHVENLSSINLFKKLGFQELSVVKEFLQLRRACLSKNI